MMKFGIGFFILSRKKIFIYMFVTLFASENISLIEFKRLTKRKH